MRPDNILTVTYLKKHPGEAARVLENFPHAMSAQLLEQLPPDGYITAFQYLMPSYGAKLLVILNEDVQKALGNELQGERLSVLLSFLDEDEKEKVLRQVSAEQRALIVRHMQYPLDSVGSIMGPALFSLPSDISAADALKRIKNSRKNYPPVIFIVDRSQHYLGGLTLNRLIKAPSHKKLGSIADFPLNAIPTRKKFRHLVNDPVWSTSLILPVTDSRGVLTGMLEYGTLQSYDKVERHVTKTQEKVQLSVLELIFQTMAILLDGLTSQFFPVSQSTDSRDTSHDNVT